MIQALPSNTGNIYIGDSAVTAAQGGVLTPGVAMNIQADSYEADADYGVIDLAQIFVDADTDGEGVAISYLEEISFDLNK